MEKKISIQGKEVIVKEIKYVDAIAIQDLDKSQMSRKLIEISTNLTADDINSLSMRDGLEIQKVINEINGFGDFQQPAKI